ncbi:MAG: hypothetical protein ACOCUF_00620 [Patescibacteria group bacterium]
METKNEKRWKKILKWPITGKAYWFIGVKIGFLLVFLFFLIAGLVVVFQLLNGNEFPSGMVVFHHHRNYFLEPVIRNVFWVDSTFSIDRGRICNYLVFPNAVGLTFSFLFVMIPLTFIGSLLDIFKRKKFVPFALISFLVISAVSYYCIIEFSNFPFRCNLMFDNVHKSSGISARSSCLISELKSSEENKDPSYCEKMTNSYKVECYDLILEKMNKKNCQDLSFCNSFPKEYKNRFTTWKYQTDCLISCALINNDKSICKKLDSEEEVEGCENKVDIDNKVEPYLSETEKQSVDEDALERYKEQFETCIYVHSGKFADETTDKIEKGSEECLQERRLTHNRNCYIFFKDKCYLDIVEINGNVLNCKKIYNSNKKDECYYKASLSLNDYKSCDNIKDKKMRMHCKEEIKKGENEKWKNYKHKSGVSFKYPANWHVKFDPVVNRIIIESEKRNGIDWTRPGMLCASRVRFGTKDNEGLSLNEYIEKYEKDAKNIKRVKVDGKNAIRFIPRPDSSYEIYISLEDSKLFYLESSLEKGHEKHEELFNKMMQSIEINESPLK